MSADTCSNSLSYLRGLKDTATLGNKCKDKKTGCCNGECINKRCRLDTDIAGDRLDGDENGNEENGKTGKNGKNGKGDRLQSVLGDGKHQYTSAVISAGLGILVAVAVVVLYRQFKDSKATDFAVPDEETPLIEEI